MKKLLFAPFLALLFAVPVRAETLKTLTLQQPQVTTDKGLQADIVEVQTHRTPVSVIATDALYGGVAGLAVGAGVALLDGGNWGRDLATGAGVGLLVGGIFGAIDVYSMSDTARPVDGFRDIGFSRAVSPLGGKF